MMVGAVARYLEGEDTGFKQVLFVLRDPRVRVTFVETIMRHAYSNHDRND